MNLRQQQAKQTRSHIYETATQLLAEKGFEDITIRDIVTRAQVSVGTFYHYYQTKTEVFNEAFALMDEYFEAEVAPQIEATPPLESISIFYRCYAEYLQCHMTLRLLTLLMQPDNKQLGRSDSYGVVHVLVEVLKRGMDQGKLPANDPNWLAQSLMCAARGLLSNWCAVDCSYNLPAAMKRQTDLWLRALR